MELTDAQIELLHGAYDVIVKHYIADCPLDVITQTDIYSHVVTVKTTVKFTSALTWEDVAFALGMGSNDRWEACNLAHKLARENKW